MMPSCAGFLEARKSRLGPSKSTFNAENFICSFFMFISIDFGAICSWNVSRNPKSPKNSRNYFVVHGHPVIEFNANREPVYNFLLVINSKLGPISHRYWDTATYWLKIANFPTPLSLSALVRGPGWPLLNWWKSFTVLKTRVFQAAEGEDLVILACTVIHLCDGRTDRVAMAKTR